MYTLEIPFHFRKSLFVPKSLSVKKCERQTALYAVMGVLLPSDLGGESDTKGYPLHWT